ncbi:MAG TPA: hypothetical protein VJU61_20730 [Polyangiaceae bacterium]|nr:hypothetical protein [Polyangiaceae bacterium]
MSVADVREWLAVLVNSRAASKLSRGAYLVLGSALGMWGAWRATVGSLTFAYRQIGAYDEGVLLTDAHLVLWGKLPYLDFYTNYPPGIFLLLAGAFKLLGVSVGVERALGLALHLAVGAAAGKLAGRLLGQRFSWISAALVLTWIEPVGMIAYTWFAGLALALLACDLWGWARERQRPAAYAVAGATLGLLSWFRHDLFIYFTLALGALGCVWIGLALRRGDRAPLGQALWTAAGALGMACLMWVPVFALAGFRQVAADLYFDQVRYTMPARVLPLPSLFERAHVDWSPVPLPAFLREPFESAVFLTFAAPVFALAALLLPRAAGLKPRGEVFWLAALSLAVWPQMLGRTDFWHAIFTVAPAVIWIWVWFRGGPARAWTWKAWPWAAAGLLLLYVPRQFNLPDTLWPPPYRPGPQPEPASHLSRAGNTFVDDTRQQVLAFVKENTEAGAPIYVGLSDHQWTHSNDMDLYFLTDRVGATRYMQFDPNLTNREDVQERMIADLERTRPQVAILSTAPQRRDEPNESQNAGATLLDDYFFSHYDQERSAGHFVLALRKPDLALPGAQ